MSPRTPGVQVPPSLGFITQLVPLPVCDQVHLGLDQAALFLLDLTPLCIRRWRPAYGDFCPAPHFPRFN